MFGYQEIYSGFDQVTFQKIRTLLEQGGIKYRDSMKDASASGAGDRRASFGTVGENQKYRMMYKISVKKDDAERAKYIIRNGN